MPKIKTKESQIKTIFNYLSNHVATASMVAEATKIPQKNITRYKRDLEHAGKLVELRKANCEVTRHKAWYITCDSSKFPVPSQLEIF